MIVARHLDRGRIYGRQRRALLALVTSLTTDELATAVPATPAWSVQDVVAHLVGIAADLNALRLDAGDPDAWTAAQVTGRYGRSLAELGAEWENEAPRFEDGLRLLGYPTGSHFVGDLLQHAQDVRAALGRSRLDDDEALVVGLDHYLDTFHKALKTAGIGSLAQTAGDERWTLGDGREAAALVATRFELFRALGGRHSAAQITSMNWSGEPDLLIPYVSAYPLPTADIVDP